MDQNDKKNLNSAPNATKRCFQALIVFSLLIVVASALFLLRHFNQKPRITSYTNSIGLTMVKIPAGSFKMGSVEDTTQMPMRQVTFDKPFYISNTTVTQSQWEMVMGTTPWIGEHITRKPDSNKPAIYTSFAEIHEFCSRLSAREGVTYRLPSEAEWEYSARAGSEGKWCFGDDENLLASYAWYFANSRIEGIDASDIGARPVAQLKPNAFGLHDVHGNVWEFCEDIWRNNYRGAPVDGSVWLANNIDGERVLRGGSDFSAPERTTSAFRINTVPGNRYANIGFRVVCEPANDVK